MNWADLNDENNTDVILAEMAFIKNIMLDDTSIVCKNAEEAPSTCINDEIETLKQNINSTILVIGTQNHEYKQYNALTLIEHQLKVINYMLKFFKVHRLQELSDYEPYLVWLMASSEYLATSIKQNINRSKSNTLMRSSYKFCNKKSDCQTHYGFLFQKKTRCCMNDHYVHNKIVSDIDNLLEYLKRNIKTASNKVVVETELKKGLETINYVVNHMYQELSSFMLYLSKSKYAIKDFYRFA